MIFAVLINLRWAFPGGGVLALEQLVGHKRAVFQLDGRSAIDPIVPFSGNLCFPCCLPGWDHGTPVFRPDPEFLHQ